MRSSPRQRGQTLPSRASEEAVHAKSMPWSASGGRASSGPCRLARAKQQCQSARLRTTPQYGKRKRGHRGEHGFHRALRRRGTAQCGFDSFEPAVDLTELLRNRSLGIRGLMP